MQRKSDKANDEISCISFHTLTQWNKFTSRQILRWNVLDEVSKLLLCKLCFIWESAVFRVTFLIIGNNNEMMWDARGHKQIAVLQLLEVTTGNHEPKLLSRSNAQILLLYSSIHQLTCVVPCHICRGLLSAKRCPFSSIAGLLFLGQMQWRICSYVLS